MQESALKLTPEGWLDVPQTRPATEYIDGRLVQKMSPRPKHWLLAGQLVARVNAWCDATGLGRCGPEADFDLTLPDGGRVRVVPDVVYLSYADVSKKDLHPESVPQRPPTVAFEIVSPNDPNRPTVQRKLDAYKKAGATVVVIDDQARTVTLHAGADQEKTFRENEILELGAMPNFRLDLSDYFRAVDE